jgi:RimJ/RimL family protein N-acetyltransferase
VLEKLGFQQEGRLRSLVQMPGGGRRDYFLYSLLADEWKGWPALVDPGSDGSGHQ